MIVKGFVWRLKNGTVPINDGDEGCDQRGRAGCSGDVGEDALGKAVGVPFRGRSRKWRGA